MNAGKNHVIPKNRIFNLFIIVSLVFSTCVGATFSGVAPFVYSVSALPPTLLKVKTMAELIFTLAAGAGTGLSGPVAVPGIYNAYGGPAYSIESMIENDIINLEGEPDALDQEIIDAIGHQDRLFDIDVDAYRDLMETDWQVMVDSGMDVALRFNDLWNSSGEYDAIDNLGAILKDVLEIGYVQGEMTIVNLANPTVTATVALDNIASALKGEYRGSIISNGADIVPPQMSSFPEYYVAEGNYGAHCGVKYISNNKLPTPQFFYDPLKIVVTAYPSTNEYQYVLRLTNVGNGDAGYCRNSTSYQDDTIASGNSVQTNINLSPNIANPVTPFGNITFFDTKAEADAYIADISNGNISIPVPSTNDLINQDDGFINLYSANPSPLINNDGIDLVDQDDYLDMVDEIQEDKEQAPDIYNLFIQPYIINEEMPAPIISPTVAPLPTYAPVRPLEPTQPVLPDKEDITSEDQEKGLTYTTPGLTEVFPFCIPFDIWKMLRTLTAEREAPVFTFPLVIESQNINEEVTVDMSTFDTVASICRMLELILFVIGLAVATRKLIGAT